MGVVDKVRAWLVFFRAHTAILETPMAVLGAALGLGTLWSPEILKWVLFGVIYHYVGYGMNSYVDWKKGFDKNDPRKQHHPLNTGDISPRSAKYATFGLLLVMIAYGEWAAGFSLWAHTAIAIMLVSGISYNYFGKYTDHKYIPISVVHTMVFVFPYFVYTNRITAPFVLATAAFFIHHVFQILISGDVKDIDMDEASLLQKWGAGVEPGDNGTPKFILSLKVYTATVFLMTAEAVIAIWVIIAQGISVVPVLVCAAMGVLMFRDGILVIKHGDFDREMRVRAMSRKELWGFWMLTGAFIPQMGVIGWISIVIASLIYFLPISKFMWGNWLKPDV